MEVRETPRMRKYGESKTTRMMMPTVPHVTSGSGRWIFVRQSVPFYFTQSLLQWLAHSFRHSLHFSKHLKKIRLHQTMRAIFLNIFL